MKPIECRVRATTWGVINRHVADVILADHVDGLRSAPVLVRVAVHDELTARSASAARKSLSR